ncbi:FG-GAP-like repeat-containing protein [Solirubrobacter ginsenosidimutans]|uniref:FG-GAP-like repeat-containing protein n=1 Tax=Solirubrobacter ginsenosidimutans TaxID=490573 RepID=A0A9X3MPR7_9ACTN|nr:SpvB/TcaC N-terminal domain-containing protein [Solirubrobacter ginsenosidimutans]MDA0160164.1 FG-GAP-like repeat-containing protein [Solirubrobacter ginsenosidimutans]
MGDANSAPGQTISVPSSGGGARGLGETFTPNLQTGTGNLTIPISLPGGRCGMQPGLDLLYSSGSGNGAFGLGWNMAVPGISRKTSHGVPRYHGEDSFLLSGAEDLVAVEMVGDGTRYRPRTEGLFASIVRHGRDDTVSGAHDYWQVEAKDGTIARYGTPRPAGAPSSWRDPAATADPRQPRHIFAWALTWTSDPHGNVVEYEYDADEGASAGHEWRRPLLRGIRYADYDAPDGSIAFLVSVALESEDRPDQFSAYTSGFEIRTSRRYRSLTTTVHPGVAQLVRKYEFAYTQDEYTGVSMLSSVAAIGFDDDGAPHRDLPAVRLGYGRLDPTDRRFEPIGGADLPGLSLARPECELVDLTGNGLPDILELNGIARYWQNLGGGVFDRPRAMARTPAGISLDDPDVQLLDADGDGRAELVVTSEALAGFFPLRFGPSWGPFQRYRSIPSTGLKHPAMRLVDLTGDGVTDAVVVGDRPRCLFSRPDVGWSGSFAARFASDPTGGGPPPLFAADPRVRWADMSGDGLRDVVSIERSSLSYWPNLGHGSWGARIRMRAAPRLPFDHDPARVLLGDVDGDGLADLVYAAGGEVVVWFNRGGNSWSEPVTVRGVPGGDWDIRLADVLGIGTSGVLFSRDGARGGPSREAMYFLDLSGSADARMLTEVDNQLGAVTRIAYRSSTTFAAADAARPATHWRTVLPFPVKVVEQVEAIDRLSGGKLTTSFRYRHGYWDGDDREFRGFAYVEQIDTETFDAYHGEGLHGSLPFTPVARQAFSPPRRTKTWFHVGAHDSEAGGQEAELDLSAEFWRGDPPLLHHADGMKAFLRGLRDASGGIDHAARKGALRALRGRVLRTEVFAVDGSVRESKPYTVTEHAYRVREEPSLPEARSHRVFFAAEEAQRVTRWERGNDPLTRFTFTGEHDPWGQPRRFTQVAAPRRSACRRPVTAAAVGDIDPDPVEALATHTRTVYATPPAGVGIHDRVADVSTYELVAAPTVMETAADDVQMVLIDQTRTAREVATTFDALRPADVNRIGHVVHHYDGNAFAGLSPRQLGARGLLTRSERLVFTDPMLRGAYGSLHPQALGGAAPPPNGAPAGGLGSLGYVWRSAGPVYAAGWYADTLVQAHDVQRSTAASPLPGRGLVIAFRDQLGHESEMTPDAYWLLPTRLRDAAGLEVSATYNYRAGRPSRVTDANGTTTTVRYDATGVVEAVVVVGRDGAGDTPERPSTLYRYDLKAFAERGQPISLRTQQRIRRASDGASDAIRESYQYSDGFGRALQSRVQADPLTFGVDGADSGLRGAGAAGPATAGQVADRWAVSGWEALDNHGRVIESYEPFFAPGADYQPEVDARRGRRVAHFYDPLGRPTRTVNPDGSQRLLVAGLPPDLGAPGVVEPTPWVATAYDENDLASLSNAPAGVSLADRAPTRHHLTPATTIADALGRTVAALARGGDGPQSDLLTRTSYDIRGNALAIIDERGRTAFQHTYDLADRLMRVTTLDGGSHISVMDAASNSVLASDARGALVLRVFDVLNRPARLLAREDATARLTVRERITYGDALPPGAGRNAAIAAQALGRVRVHDDEAGRVVINQYDEVGRALSHTRTVVSNAALAAGWEPNWSAPGADSALEPGGSKSTCSFDLLGRPLQLRVPGGQTIVPRYGRSGQLESVSVDGVPIVKYIAYNARGERVFLERANGLVTRYAYDPDRFRLTRMRTERMTRSGQTWSSAGVLLQDLTYSHDLVGNVVRIDDRTPASGIAGTPAGRDRLVRRFGYDPFYRLTSATGRACADIGGQRSLRDAPRCGAIGASYARRPVVPDQHNAPDLTAGYVESYRYDETNNLLDLHYRPASGAGWHRLFGVGGEAVGDSANAPNNRLTSVRNPGSALLKLDYDAAGNLHTEGGTQTLRWDYTGRMVGFTVQAGAGTSMRARYLYGADGMRVKKWIRRGAADDEDTIYHGELSEQHSWSAGGGGVSDVLHVHVGASRAAVIRTGDRHRRDFGPPLRYELGDHLGSSAVTVDEAATWVSREEYFPFGETSFGGFAHKRYRFQGVERDEESGLSCHGARYYAAPLARWTALDPAGPVEGPNRYVAFRNNPISNADTSGCQSNESGNILNGTSSANGAGGAEGSSGAGGAAGTGGAGGGGGATGAGGAGGAGAAGGAGGAGGAQGGNGASAPAPSAPSDAPDPYGQTMCYDLKLPLLPPLIGEITDAQRARHVALDGPQWQARPSGPRATDDAFLKDMQRTGQNAAINSVAGAVLGGPTVATLFTRQAVMSGLTSSGFNVLNQYSQHGTNLSAYNVESIPVDYVLGAFSSRYVTGVCSLYQPFSRDALTGALKFSFATFGSQQARIIPYIMMSSAARATVLDVDSAKNLKSSLANTLGAAIQSVLMQWFLKSDVGTAKFPMGQNDGVIIVVNRALSSLRSWGVGKIWNVNASNEPAPSTH